MKVLYAHEISGDSLEWVMMRLHHDAAHSNLADFARTLVERTDELATKLDDIIANHVEKWELDRIARLDHIILRLAICEIRYFDDIPPKVAINEAIEIAKKYSTGKSDKFINGVLDAVLRQKKDVNKEGKREKAKTDNSGI